VKRGPLVRSGAVLAVLAALSLASCGPPPGERADVCAILALPGVPGDSKVGDAADLAWSAAREHALLTRATIYGPGWRIMGHTRWWGACAARAKPVEMLLISPDHRYAMTKGGRRAHGRPVSFGACSYEKLESGWRLRACRLTGGF
jgi:hypothetical protein